MKREDIREFFKNFESYLEHTHKGDAELVSVYGPRLIRFLQTDMEEVKTRKQEENPWNAFVRIALIILENDGDNGAEPLVSILEKADKLSKVLREHWQNVKGTDAGDKLPMINFTREKAKELGLPDHGMVHARKFIEASGLYNSATDNSEDSEGSFDVGESD